MGLYQEERLDLAPSHNPKVVGSNPTPATKEALVRRYVGPGLRRFRGQSMYHDVPSEAQTPW